MTILENSEQIRIYTDKLKESSSNEDKLEYIDTLNSLWINRELLLDSYQYESRDHFRGYASGIAEGYRMMYLILNNKQEEI